MESSEGGGGARGSEVQRLFFALWPDAAIRRQLGLTVEGLRAQHAMSRHWVAPDLYHLTLQFLGDYVSAPQGLIDEACAAGESVRVTPFNLTLDCVGSFRNRSIPWWLGSRVLPDSLRAVWDQLGVALQARRVSFDTRREFLPHVTVLRDAPCLLPDTEVTPVVWPLREFVLMESRLGGKQPGYRVLRQFPLRH